MRGIAVSGSYLYLATTSGLQIIDISDRDNPQWVAIYDDEQVFVNKVQIRGNYAYLLTRNGLTILDISQSPAVTPVGFYATEIRTPLDLDILDNYVLLKEGYPDDQVHIVDISDPNNPTLVHIKESVSDSLAVTADRYLVVNNACSSTCFTWLSVLDWNPPEDWTLTFLGVHDTFGSGWTHEVVIQKFYAYVGKDIGMVAYNYYQKGEFSSTVPRVVAYYDIGDVGDIVPTDEFIYVASQEQGFFIIEAPPQIHTYLPVVAQD